MKILLYIIFLVSLLGCNSNLQEQQNLNNRNGQSSDETQLTNEEDSEEEEEYAELPTMVTGAFLTCSWTNESTSKQSDPNLVAGCNVFDEQQKQVVDPTNEYFFEIKDKGVTVSEGAVPFDSDNSAWDIYVNDYEKVDFKSETLEVVATSRVTGLELSTRIPPCYFCYANKKMAEFNKLIHSNNLAWSEVLLKYDDIKRQRDYLAKRVGDVQINYADIIQDIADVKQDEADLCQQKVNGETINDPLVVSCVNQGAADNFQSVSNDAQGDADQAQGYSNERSNDYNRIYSDVILMELYKEEVREISDGLVVHQEKSNGLYEAMVPFVLKMITLEDYIKFSKDPEYLKAYENFKEFEEPYSKILNDTLNEINAVVDLYDSYMTLDLENPADSVLYNNFKLVMDEYCGEFGAKLENILNNNIWETTNSQWVAYCTDTNNSSLPFCVKSKFESFLTFRSEQCTDYQNGETNFTIDLDKAAEANNITIE